MKQETQVHLIADGEQAKSAQPPSHTRGPWEFARLLSASENDKGFRVVSHASRYSGGRWIADVSPVNDSDGNASAEGLANVRLIAAAPDLLAAMQGAIALADANVRPKFSDGTPDRTPECAASYAACVAAVAKATGGAA